MNCAQQKEACIPESALVEATDPGVGVTRAAAETLARTPAVVEEPGLGLKVVRLLSG